MFGRAPLRSTICVLALALVGCGGHDLTKRIYVENPGPTSSCALLPPATSPASGSVVVAVTLTSTASLTLVFTYSTDAGTSFGQATPTVDSLLANPATGVMAAPGLSFEWDSAADLPGVQPVDVVFRMQANPVAGSCQVGFAVVNAHEPTCALEPPALAPAGALVPLTARLFDPEGDLGRATLCFSANAGASFLPATLRATTAGSLAPYAPGDPGADCASGAGNQVVDLPPATPIVLTWDAAADGLDRSRVVDVTLRLSVEDGSTAGAGPFSSCEASLQVLANEAPTCAIVSPTGGSLQGPVSVELTIDDPDDATSDLLFSYSTDAGASFAVATAAPGSALASPATGVPTGGGPLTFSWDADADLPAGSSVVVRFRVSASDAADPGGSRPVTCDTTFGWGAAIQEALLSLRAVTALGDRGSPLAGSPSVGNPKGDYASLDAREFSTIVALAAGGSPALLFAPGESTRPVIEGALALAGAVDLSDASNPWGTTTYASANAGMVAVAGDGTLTAMAGNVCSEITATFTPDPVALPGSPVAQVRYAACVDLAGVDNATRAAAGPRLAVGELDACLPGLPSGPAPGGAGSKFGLLVTVDTGASELSAHSVEVQFDPALLAVDAAAPGALMGVAGSSTTYGGPTIVNGLVAGVISFNHFYTGPPVSGVFDLAEVRFDVLGSGTASITTCINVLGDSGATPIGAPGPRIAPAGTGMVVLP